jgi:hypothetical protein
MVINLLDMCLRVSFGLVESAFVLGGCSSVVLVYLLILSSILAMFVGISVA